MAMRDEIERVTGSAARAALNPALWPETLHRLSTLIGADMTLLEHVDKRANAVEIGFTDRPDIVAACRESYERHFWKVNPRYEMSLSSPAGAVQHDDLLGDDRALGRLEYYVDHLGPIGLKYFIGSRIAEDAEHCTILSLQRCADRGRVGNQEKAIFALVLPAIENAVALYVKRMKGPPGETLAEVLDRIADPIAVLRADGRLLFANSAMTGLIAAGDLLRLRGRGLTGAGETTRRALDEAMRRALADGGAPMTAAATGAGPILFRIVPLAPWRAHELLPGEDRLLCLMIDDPRRPHWPSVDEVMRLFGLTRREATVGTHLAAGLTVSEIAGRLGVSRNTVRTHLAMLRDKLGVRSALAVAAQMRRAVGPSR